MRNKGLFAVGYCWSHAFSVHHHNRVQANRSTGPTGSVDSALVTIIVQRGSVGTTPFPQKSPIFIIGELLDCKRGEEEDNTHGPI